MPDPAFVEMMDCGWAAVFVEFLGSPNLKAFFVLFDFFDFVHAFYEGVFSI